MKDCRILANTMSWEHKNKLTVFFFLVNTCNEYNKEHAIYFVWGFDVACDSSWHRFPKQTQWMTIETCYISESKFDSQY